jgi:hypothetical protein
MSRSIAIAGLATVLVGAGVSTGHAQGMLLDFIADRVIQHYQTATCEQLQQDKAEGPSEMDKLALDFLRDDKQARVAFIDKIAATVANKMFQCGMFP